MLTAPRVMAFVLTVILASVKYADAHKEIDAANEVREKLASDISTLWQHII